MQVQIVYNPASGRTSPRCVARVAAAFAAHGACVTMTETGAAPPAIDERADHVVVIGGDGTVRHVAHAIGRLDAPPPLSVYPGGTVNLLAREWTGPRSPVAFATRVLAREERMRFAVGHASGGEDGAGLFLCCAGAGWESVVVASVDLRLKRLVGRCAYVVAALRSLARWRPTTIVLVADGRTVACEGFHLAKGVHYAGRWRLAGRALAHEPLMQVVALRRARRRDLARFWLALATGRAMAAVPWIEVIECRTLEASAAGPVPVQADGDLIGTLPMTFRVVDRAITTC